MNTVVPGQLYTPMVDVRLAKQRAGGDVTALLAQRQSRIPMPFMGDGRDTAMLRCFWLLMRPASSPEPGWL